MRGLFGYLRDHLEMTYGVFMRALGASAAIKFCEITESSSPETLVVFSLEGEKASWG